MSATSGKPDGFQVPPLEPRVQGRFARIAMAEDASLFQARTSAGRVHEAARAPCKIAP